MNGHPDESSRRIDDAVREIARAAPGTRIDLAGLAGGAGAMLAARLQERIGRPVLVVTVGAGQVRRWADDLAHFGSRFAVRGSRTEGADAVVTFAEREPDPYSEIVPDRSLVHERVRGLSRLAAEAGPVRFVVAAAEAFLRRVAPPDALRARCVRLRVGAEASRDDAVRLLVEGGYHPVRAVDVPGTFAVRGGLLDVFPPGADFPYRIEWTADVPESIRLFDPADQRSIAPGGCSALRASPPPGPPRTLAAKPLGSFAPEGCDEAWIHPITELVRGEAERRSARDRLRELCDARGLPTVRAREWVELVESGAPFPGIETLLPAFHARLASLDDYLPDGAVVFVDNPPAAADVWRRERESIERAYAAVRDRPVFEPSAISLSPVEAAAVCGRRAHLLSFPPGAAAVKRPRGWAESGASPLRFGASDNEDLSLGLRRARRDRSGASPLGPLARFVADGLDSGLRVVLASPTPGGCERLAALLRGHGLVAADGGRRTADARRGRYEIEEGPLARGFRLPADGLAYVAEEEVFGARARRPRGRPASAGPDLRDLAAGDHVVHVEYGIGRYDGLVRRVVDGVEIDLMHIAYRGTDRLLLPVYHANQVAKYVGKAEPQLDRLGSGRFRAARERAGEAAQGLADELLRAHAERAARPGRAVAPADDAFEAFVAEFRFEETPDQARAIEGVIEGLEREAPLDHLVCGDVGFGKTEVAMRAAFRAVRSGRQVAVLAPTTILAQQHLATFRERFRNFPARIEPLFRFQTAAEQSGVVRGLKTGEVDVAIGTHRLLSADVHFKDLGLIVIDEEHRFGVAHKQRLARLRSGVDVLTMTATPIPRTLNLALSGLRDMSLIVTPPQDRLAIRTTVAQDDDDLIAGAIRRELSREGQVFFVHNRVETIHRTADRLRALAPEARFAVAHGQMDEDALERVMVDFVAGRYDVLVCTAIIESGLDIPRANTILIDRADTFGLAQLHQIRGRVGRSRLQAFCWLLVPPWSAMTADARRRIDALARLASLGSGFHLASLDLEIRGGGEILGSKQSGHVAAVGFDTYCHLLGEAVARLRGETPPAEFEPELTVDEAALLPEDYIEDPGQRLALYRRLASAADEAEVREGAAEMRDRFGPLPAQAERFVELMALKTALRRIRAAGLEARGGRVTVHLRHDTTLDPARVLDLVRRAGSPYVVTRDLRVQWHAPADDARASLERAAAVLHDLAACVRPGGG